jgi:hypothetical protein
MARLFLVIREKITRVEEKPAGIKFTKDFLKSRKRVSAPLAPR